MTIDDVVKLAIDASSFGHFQTMLMIQSKKEARDKDREQRYLDRDLHGPAGQD